MQSDTLLYSMEKMLLAWEKLRKASEAVSVIADPEPRGAASTIVTETMLLLEQGLREIAETYMPDVQITVELIGLNECQPGDHNRRAKFVDCALAEIAYAIAEINYPDTGDGANC